MPRFPKDPDEVRMSLGEHLEELRHRIILALLGVAIAFFACFAFSKPIVKFLVDPARSAIQKVNDEVRQRQASPPGPGDVVRPGEAAESEPPFVVLTPVEGFSAILKASLVASILISSPWVLYQFWLFVAAGLYPHERRIIHIFFPFSAGLFFAGAAFSYTLVIRYGIYVLLTFGGLVGDMVRPEIRLSSAIDFVLVLSLVMGAVFQLPLVMLALSKVGLISPSAYVKQWRYAVAAIVIIAGVLTPPDAFTQIAMAVPMLGLYWLGVLLTRIFVKKA